MALLVVGAEDDLWNTLTKAEQRVRAAAAVHEQGATEAARVEELRIHGVLEARVLHASEILQARRCFTLGRRNGTGDDRVRGVLAVIRDFGTDAIVPEAGVE